MADIYLKDANGEKQLYTGIKSVSFDGATEGQQETFIQPEWQDKTVTVTQNGTAEVEPDSGYDGLSKVTVDVDVPTTTLETLTTSIVFQGDEQIMKTAAPSGVSYSEVDIVRPQTLIPENIKENVQIAGIVGTYVGGGETQETEEKTVVLDMEMGDQVVLPTEGKLLSKVTVTKPASLVSDNIRIMENIGGVVGTLYPADTFVEAAWSDDEKMCLYGFGIARDDLTGIHIKAYMLANDINPYEVIDTPYQYFFTKPWSTMANTDLAANIEAFCGSVLNNDSFSYVFSGADAICFMDTLHRVGFPDAGLSGTATARFVTALNDTLSDLPYSPLDPLFMVPSDYSEGFESMTVTPSGICHLPFVWFPAVKDGSPIKTGDTLQAPTGTMTTYQSMYKTYTWEDTLLSNNGSVSITVGYVNALIPFGSSDFVCWIIGDGSGGLLWWSIKDQLVRKELLQMIRSDWASGDVTLAQGFNMTTSASAGSNTTVPITDEQLSAFTVKGDNIPLSEMDGFEKSFYKELTRQPYRRLNKKSVTIDFTIKMPPDTNTTTS